MCTITSLRFGLTHEQRIGCLPLLSPVHADAARAVALRVHVHKERFLAFEAERGRQIDGSGGLSHAPLLVRNRNNFPHSLPLPRLRRAVSCQRNGPQNLFARFMIHRASRARAVRAQGYLRQHANHTRLDLPLFIISSFQGGKKSEIRFFHVSRETMWKTEKKMRRLPRTERKKRRVLAHAVRQTLGRSAGAGAFHYFLGSSRSQRGGDARVRKSTRRGRASSK